MMKKKSLSYKITMGFLISFCLPLTIFLVVWMYQMTYMQEQNVENQVKNDLAGITGEISHRIQEMEITARSIASNPELIDYLENYSHDPKRYLLKAVEEFGMLLGSISQMNPRIESLRIYAMDNRIPRYQNTIYPKRVMQDQVWMKPVENLAYEGFYIGPSTLLYEAQNEENYRQRIFWGWRIRSWKAWTCFSEKKVRAFSIACKEIRERKRHCCVTYRKRTRRIFIITGRDIRFTSMNCQIRP